MGIKNAMISRDKLPIHWHHWVRSQHPWSTLFRSAEAAPAVLASPTLLHSVAAISLLLRPPGDKKKPGPPPWPSWHSTAAAIKAGVGGCFLHCHHAQLSQVWANPEPSGLWVGHQLLPWDGVYKWPNPLIPAHPVCFFQKFGAAFFSFLFRRVDFVFCFVLFGHAVWLAGF